MSMLQLMHVSLIGQTMPTYNITYGDREMLPAKLDAQAASLDLTPEQLIKRFIVEGLVRLDNSDDQEQSTPGENLDALLVLNGVLKPRI